MESHKKKILYVVEAMGGGVFTYIVDLANELVKEYDMYIAYAVRIQTPSNYYKYFDRRIHLIEVKNFGREINPIKDIKAFSEIKEIVKKLNPDIIHFHSSKAGVIGRIAFNGKQMPMFYTPHGYSFLMKNYNTTRRMLFRMIETLCAKTNCMTISCSAGEYQETLKLTRHAMYINNGINTKTLQKMVEEVEVKDHPFTVFTLGRICYQKNPILFNRVAEAMPDVRFLWIGEGELQNELKASNIEITGWSERADALRKSMNADVFILTSLWEGLPISLLECMYMKKPCVVSDVIGNHDVIRNEENGYVCNSVDDFVKAISKIRAGKAKKVIEKAYKDIFDFYDTKVQAKAYSKIYMAHLKNSEQINCRSK